MTITIDSAGRVVIPKPLREALNLGSGSEIEIASEGDSLRLRLAGGQPARVSRKRGFLVHVGPGTSDLKIGQFIKLQREGRAKRGVGAA